MSLSYNELKPGIFIDIDGEPWEILDYAFLRMQQRKPVAKTKLRNLVTGRVMEQTFHQSDKIEEADLNKEDVKFIYANRGEYWFTAPNDLSKRFSLKTEKIAGKPEFLKPNIVLTALKFGDDIVEVKLPIKVEYKVTEAPPAIKGNTAQGGNKLVTIEGGGKVLTPLFVNEGDIIRVNTESGEYVERVNS